MANKRNIIILDTETTGLDPSLGCEVIEIAATCINAWDLEDHHIGDFHCLIKPNRPEKAQAGAIEVTGDLFEKAKTTGLEAKVVWKKFADYVASANETKGNMGKPIFMAYNKDFDSKFVRFHMAEYGAVGKDKIGLPDYPWGFEFDAMQLAFTLFESDSGIPNFKLDTILERIGLSRNQDTHNALEDVKLLKQFVKRSMKFYRESSRKIKIANELPKR